MSSHGLSSSTRHSLQVARATRYFSQCRLRAREKLPSIAPKISIDIKRIRQNPESYSQNCLERNYKPQSDHPFQIIKLFDQWRASQEEARSLREKSNAIQKQLSRSKPIIGRKQVKANKAREALILEARNLKAELSSIETHEAQLISDIDDLAAELPNLTSLETPREAPRTVGYINEDLKPEDIPLTYPYNRKNFTDHVRIAAELDLLDFSGAATTSGWGWYFFKNEGVLLEQALIQYALSVAMKHGFSPVTPPSMVYSHIAAACGFRPRDQSGEQQVYDIQQNEKDIRRDKPPHSLAGTAEIPFAGMKANEIIDQRDLPIQVVGPSRCYRAEAGARGADTKGLYRVHEFTKVEMFAWTAPGFEESVFELMLEVQKIILEGLGLHCRILEMPSSDLGASAVRKQDIEVYFPSRKSQNEGWGEVTSTSICTDYQTRRLNTKVKHPAECVVETNFPSTVNGTALAVPRILAALLEYRCRDLSSVPGSKTMTKPSVLIEIPRVLWPWTHGKRTIKKIEARIDQLEQERH